MKGDLMSFGREEKKYQVFLPSSKDRSMLHIYWIPNNKARPMKVKSLLVRFLACDPLLCRVPISRDGTRTGCSTL